MSNLNETSEARKNLLLNGLVKLGLMFGKDLPDPLMEAYSEGLADLTEAQLRQVFGQAILECKFMPTVAELRGFLKQRQAKVDSLEAEQEWEVCCAHLRKYGEVTYDSDQPLVLTAAGEYAFRQIGWRKGLVRVLDYDDKGMQFAHKRFIEAYNTHVETGGLLAPSREEAQKMLATARGLLEAKRDETK